MRHHPPRPTGPAPNLSADPRDHEPHGTGNAHCPPDAYAYWLAETRSHLERSAPGEHPDRPDEGIDGDHANLDQQDDPLRGVHDEGPTQEPLL